MIRSIVEEKGLYVIQGAQCPEIGLSNNSPADVVISTENKTKLKPDEIKVIFEVKMSLVWNWQFKENEIIEFGDFKTHQGQPGLLRSDSTLKAIGKCINIRVSDYQSAQIPLIVIGNTPIKKSYYSKVDHLKKAGIIQGFWSINPKPLNKENTIKNTLEKGFIRFDSKNELKINLNKLFDEELNFFSSMKTTSQIGHFIEIANMQENL